MLSEIITRLISELGPWLWIAAGFLLMTIEIFSGRAIALSLALGSFITGTISVMGASGVWPATSHLSQAVIFAGLAIAIFLAIKSRTKTT